MFIKKILLTISIILTMCVSGLWAGDSASFVDLGFSSDGKTYMFGQYGVLSPSLRPWAELYIVDVAGNKFVPNGKVSIVQDAAIIAGQDGSGVFHRLVSNNSGLSGKYGINFQNQGLPLYISRDENPPANGETICFRDFVSGRSFKAQLVPTITGSGQNIQSKFFINLEVTSEVNSSNKTVKTYTVGTPNFLRQKISSYNFKRVHVDASGNSIIFVIEMKRAAENGHDIRYMVETVRL